MVIVLLGFSGLMMLVGICIGLAVGQRTLVDVVQFGVAGAVLGLVSAAGGVLIVSSIFMLSAARVAYFVRGEEIVVVRGRSELAVLDTRECLELWGTGWVTTRSLVLDVGNVLSLHGDLPCVAYRTSDADPARLLPRVLIVDADRIEAFWTALREELVSNGMPRERWTSSPR